MNRFLLQTMRGTVLSLLLFCTLSGASLAAAELIVDKMPRASFDAALWQDDYASLKTQLEHQYANLAWFGSPQSRVNLPQLDRHTRQLLQAAESDSDARSALLEFVRTFRDGHFRQKPVLEPAQIGTMEPPRPALAELDGAGACAAIGVASTSAVPFSLPIESLPNFVLVSDGVSEPFRSGWIVNAGGIRIGVLRIPAFVMSEYLALCRASWTELKKKAVPITAKLLEDAIADNWLKSLAFHVRRLGAQGLDALVVDVGGNGGGGDTGDSSVRLFSSKQIHSARLLMAAMPATKAYFDEQLDGLHAALDTLPKDQIALRAAISEAISAFEARKDQVKARACDLSWVWREQRPWSPDACSALLEVGFASGGRDFLAPVAAEFNSSAASLYWPALADPYRGAWDGPVYVLTDGKVASAAELFVATMRDNGIAKVIGSPTLGLGCGNMVRQQIIELAHSHLRFQTPDCVRLRADGSDEVAGIAPDLPLLPRHGESARARAMRLLDTIARDLGEPRVMVKDGTAPTER